MSNLQNTASHRAVLELALDHAVDQLEMAETLMAELRSDYAGRNQKRWSVAYRYVVSCKELVSIASDALETLDLVEKAEKLDNKVD